MACVAPLPKSLPKHSSRKTLVGLVITTSGTVNHPDAPFISSYYSSYNLMLRNWLEHALAADLSNLKIRVAI